MPLTLDRDTHVYTLDGAEIPGTTDILSSVGVRDKSKNWHPIITDFNHDEIACNFGNALHAVAKYDGDGIPCEYDPQMEPWVEQYRRFWASVQPCTIMCNEQPLYSKLYGYAGTPDRVYMKDGIIYLRDWKSAEARSKSWRYQLSAYRQLIIERFELKSNARIECATVRFLKNRFIVDPWTDMPGAFMTFKSALNIYKAFQKKGIDHGNED